MTWWSSKDKPEVPNLRLRENIFQEYLSLLPKIREERYLTGVTVYTDDDSFQDYHCQDCGSVVRRTFDFDGIQVHENWHWNVGA